jgi:ABC-type sugar transport system substrate-binding protein
MGRGFAVVASEVRKLAENSVIATREVNSLVTSIQSSAQEAVVTMNLGVKEVENGVELANQSGKALDSIIATSELVSKGLIDVVNISKRQVNLSSDLGSAMESVSAVVEQNTATTEEMAATADDISQEMKNVAKVSHENRTTAIGVARLTDEITNLVTDSTASAQTLAEMASAFQNLVAAYHTDSEEVITTAKVRKSENKPTIGVIVPNNNRFWSTAIKFAQIGASELGINLVVKESDNQKEMMEQNIRQIVDQKVDGILWVPYFGLCRMGLTLARESEIPVVLIDSYQGGLQPKSEEFPNYVAFVGPADETGAYEMGKYLLTHIPESKDGRKYIVALDGPRGASASILRHKGLIRAIKEHPEAVLVSSRDSDYTYDLAKKNMSEMLKEYPVIQGVWAANDLMIQGAMDAVKETKRTPGRDIFFVGMALDQKSISAIRDGEQLFDIGGHWLQLGFGLSILYDHINGYLIPKGRSIVKLPLLPLTKDKVDQYEKDFPNGIPNYNFRQRSRAYNPNAPISFFEMKYSAD